MDELIAAFAYWVYCISLGAAKYEHKDGYLFYTLPNGTVIGKFAGESIIYCVERNGVHTHGQFTVAGWWSQIRPFEDCVLPRGIKCTGV